jgi:hypothetical protein
VPLLMFGAAFGTHSNFIIGADRIRRCLIVSCCAGNVIARRISARGRQQIRKRKSRKLLQYQYVCAEPPKADIGRTSGHVRFVPKADILHCGKSVVIRSSRRRPRGPAAEKCFPKSGRGAQLPDAICLRGFNSTPSLDYSLGFESPHYGRRF